MPPPYDATADGVRALVPNVPITANSRPSEAQVAGWIVELAAHVDARLGPLDDLDAANVARIETEARRLVHLGAAAYTEDAAHPERASKADTRYGAVLWARFTQGLDALEVTLGELRAGEEEAEGAGDLGPVRYSFPPPMRLGL